MVESVKILMYNYYMQMRINPIKEDIVLESLKDLFSSVPVSYAVHSLWCFP